MRPRARLPGGGTQLAESLAAVPAAALERIAYFPDGVAMYNLALTAKHPFFSEYFIEAVDPQQRGSVLATRLLRIAIEATMARLVAGVGGQKRSGWVSANLDMEKLQAILSAADAEAPDQCIVSGSLVVQAVLGAEWPGSDIDLFCSSQAAPYVRASLVNVAGFGFLDFKEGRYEVLEAARRHEGQIEHVEAWVVLPEEGSELWGEDTPEAREAHAAEGQPAVSPPCRALCLEFGRQARIPHPNYPMHILFDPASGHGMDTAPEVGNENGLQFLSLNFPNEVTRQNPDSIGTERTLRFPQDNPLPYNRHFDEWPGFCNVADLIVVSRRFFPPRSFC